MTQKSDISSTDLITSMNDTKDDDLEDGEIEDDDEDDEENNKINEDIIEATKLKSKTLTDIISYEKIELKQQQQQQQQSLKKDKKQQQRNRPTTLVEDDWAGNVENAIAMALKKDGIEPSSSSSLLPTISDSSKNPLNNKCDDDDRRKPKKRKKQRDNLREKRKKRHKSDLEIEKPEEELDDYEMLCIRGGSPPPYTGSTVLRHDEESYESSYSNSSYDSYDSNEPIRRYEDRRQRRHLKDRRLQRKGIVGPGGRNDNKRQMIMGRGGHGCDSDNDDIRHELRPNRKMELCKFYLMECCAKRDKCLYMHSDFPCKYYYLGIKCVMKDNCKFAHGKPLTDSLRTTLLKHLETAPKEILGDFPRLSRDNAIKMMDTTHISLMADFGLKPTLPLLLSTSNNSQQQLQQHQQLQQQQQSLLHASLLGISNNNNNNATILQQQINSIPQLMCSGNNNNNKIPSLLEIITKPPTTANIIKSLNDKIDKHNNNNKMDNKPRRTRWCTTTATLSSSSSQSQSQPSSLTVKQNSMMPSSAILSPPQQTQSISSTLSVPASSSSLLSTNSSNANYLSLKNLTGVITPTQIQKLEAIGIENLDQINQLTVAQLNDLGLSINQIHDIQLNALNIQKLGLSTKMCATSPSITSGVIVKPPTQLITNTTTAEQLINNNNNNVLPMPSPFFCDIIGTGGKDQDMRINPGQINSTIDITLGVQDVDMRVLPTILQNTNTQFNTQIFDKNNLIASADDDDDDDNDDDDNKTSIENDNILTDRLTKSSLTQFSSASTILQSSNEPSIIDYNKFMTKPTQSSVVDYTQYLKDSNIENMIDSMGNDDSDDQNELKIECDNDNDNDDDDDDDDDDHDENKMGGDNNSIHEDESELQIDESWCPSDDESNKNKEDDNDEDDDINIDKNRDVNNDCSNKKSSENNNKVIKEESTEDNKLENTDSSSTCSKISNSEKVIKKCENSNDNDDDDNDDKDDKNLNEDKIKLEKQKTNELLTSKINKYESSEPINYLPAYASSLLPAIIEPVTIHAPDLMTSQLGSLSKIDLSASVAQMLQKARDHELIKTDKFNTDNSIDDIELNNKLNEIIMKESRDPRLNILSRDPRTTAASATTSSGNDFNKLIKDTNESRDPRTNNFEYYTKTPETTITSAAAGTTTSLSSSTSQSLILNPESITNRTLRRTIYDLSLSDSEDILTKKVDKDMRIQPFFVDTESANGDIDFRLPFKPIMANYVPATEIDASITSHSPIEYRVVEIDIPTPDFREIRRNIPNQERTIDPRLRRIFSMKEDSDTETGQIKNTDPFQIATTTNTIVDNTTTVRRSDPRRKKDDDSNMNILTNSSSITSLMTTSTLNQQLPLTTTKTNDIHFILQKSLWYKDLSSKQKILVNQHLAEFSSELKKFHQDTNPDKLFDTTIVTGNPSMHQILINLGVFINESGQFNIICQTDDNPNNLMNNPNNLMNINHIGGIGVNLTQVPPLMMGGVGGNIDMNDFLTNMRVAQQQQQQMLPNNMNIIRPNYLNNMNYQQRFMGDSRPGLLGIAPNIPFNYDGGRTTNNYNNNNNNNVFDEQQQTQQQQLQQQGNFKQNFNTGGNIFDNNNVIGTGGGGGGYSGGNNYGRSVGGGGEGRGRNYRGNRGNSGGNSGSSSSSWRNMGSRNNSGNNNNNNNNSNNNNSGSGRNGTSRRNYDRDRDRRDKSKN